MSDLVPNQYLIEELINNTENQIKTVNDIQVRPLVHLVLQDIVVINRQPTISMLKSYKFEFKYGYLHY